MTKTWMLGAEELLELGRGPESVDRLPWRRPFLSGRPHAELGQFEFLAQAGSFITGILGTVFSTIGDLVNLPTGLLSQGLDFLVNNTASFLSNIPVLGPLIGQALVLGAAVVKFGLSIPGALLNGLGSVMTGLSEAMKQVYTPGEEQNKKDLGIMEILKKAPELLRPTVGTMLGASKATVQAASTAAATTPPAGGTGIGDILSVGVPVAAGAAAAYLLFLR